MSRIMGFSISTISGHLKKIGKVRKKKLDKWIPHELSESQKDGHFGLCSMLFL